MTLLFSTKNNDTNRGRAVRIHNGYDAVVGSIVQPSGWGGFDRMMAIFTNMSVKHTGNYQIQPMLGRDTYVDVFGDAPGQLQLGGLAFYSVCSGDQIQGGGTRRADGSFDATRKTGLARVLEWYNQMRIARRQEPLLLTLGPDTVYEGFLTSIQATAADVEHRVDQFTLMFTIMPPDDLYNADERRQLLNGQVPQ